jgi:hypothetical protein
MARGGARPGAGRPARKSANTSPPPTRARARAREAAGNQRPWDEYYCFEINPSPGFIFYERMTGQPISEAVAHILRGREPVETEPGRVN